MTDLGLIIYYRCDLLEIHYRNACATKLHMLVAVTFHFLHRVKVLANELLEYACACSKPFSSSNWQVSLPNRRLISR